MLRLTITGGDSQEPLATALLNTNLVRDNDHLLGRSYDIPLDRPIQVQQGERYGFTVELVSGGSVISGGSVFTWEGAWDDPVPVGVCALPLGVTVEDKPPSGLIMDARDCTQRLDAWSGLLERLPAGHRLRGRARKARSPADDARQQRLPRHHQQPLLRPAGAQPDALAHDQPVLREAVRRGAGLRSGGDVPGDVPAWTAARQRPIPADR
ncbi:MAG: hypothetical protein U0521_01240 [Anaerolineae bacterium]